MTHTYCASCNRVRLTADGRLRTCLFGDHEVDLRTPLRAGEPLEPFFRHALAEQAEGARAAADEGRRAARAVAGWRLSVDAVARTLMACSDRYPRSARSNLGFAVG